MRRLIYNVFLLALLFQTAAAQTPQSESTKDLNIGLLIDGPWDRNDGVVALFETEISDLMSREFNINYPPARTIISDWKRADIETAFKRLLDDSGIDIIITLGAIGSEIASQYGPLPKPVIAPFVINIDLQQVPFNGASSGVKNLSYIAADINFENNMSQFLEVVPFDTIYFLWPRVIVEGIPPLKNDFEHHLISSDITSYEILVDSLAQPVLDAIPSNAQAVQVGILINMPESEIDKLYQGLNDRKIPTLSYIGRNGVVRGLLAGIGEGIDFPMVARRTALNLQRIVLGEKAEDLPVALKKSRQLYINVGTARSIGVSPSWGVLTMAELINEERTDIDRKINILQAIDESLKANLDLKSETYSVSAGRQDVNKARSNLFPQIDLSATGLMIDEDRAAASLGSQAERTLSGSASLTQIIYSEPVYANLSIQKDLQKSREWQLHQKRLDIITETGKAYLNLLNAKTIERIQIDNLKLTRSNLNLAQNRKAIGTSGPGEVYRWQSELASNRKAVVEAQARRNVAEIQLNRILNHPAEESFLTEETKLNDFILPTIDEKIFKYMNNKQDFKLFRNFVVQETFANSPELQQLEAAIKAQKRLAGSTASAFWSPTLALKAEASKQFEEGGARTDFSLANLFPPEAQSSFTTADDLNWSLAVNLQFPLFSGGAKFADRKKAVQEVAQLEIERDALRDRLEQRTRTALHLAGASWAGIEFSRDAAEAAHKNLELVTDGYSRGLVSITDLLEAQNAALVADQVASQARYQFFIDIIEVFRAAGRFYFLEEYQARLEVSSRLNKFFEENKTRK